MNETQLIENYLNNQLQPEERLWVEAKMLIDKDFYDTIQWQQKSYTVIMEYGRNKLKKEIEQVHYYLFSEAIDRSFRIKIKNIFKK